MSISALKKNESRAEYISPELFIARERERFIDGLTPIQRTKGQLELFPGNRRLSHKQSAELLRFLQVEVFYALRHGTIRPPRDASFAARLNFKHAKSIAETPFPEDLFL